MVLNFGFLDGEMTDPQEQGLEGGETFTVEPGQTYTDAHGNTYTANSRDEK